MLEYGSWCRALQLPCEHRVVCVVGGAEGAGVEEACWGTPVTRAAWGWQARLPPCWAGNVRVFFVLERGRAGVSAVVFCLLLLLGHALGSIEVVGGRVSFGFATRRSGMKPSMAMIRERALIWALALLRVAS